MLVLWDLDFQLGWVVFYGGRYLIMIARDKFKKPLTERVVDFFTKEQDYAGKFTMGARMTPAKNFLKVNSRLSISIVILAAFGSSLYIAYKPGNETNTKTKADKTLVNKLASKVAAVPHTSVEKRFVPKTRVKLDVSFNEKTRTFSVKITNPDKAPMKSLFLRVTDEKKVGKFLKLSLDKCTNGKTVNLPKGLGKLEKVYVGNVTFSLENPGKVRLYSYASTKI